MNRVLAATDLESAELTLSSGYGGMRISAQGQRRGLRMFQAHLTPAVGLHHLRFQMSVGVESFLATLGASPGLVLVAGLACNGD